MKQTDLNREGYAIFVRCCDLGTATPTPEFVHVIETLDRILFEQIGKNREDFFPNPYGGAIYHKRVDEALAAARALVSGFGKCGISGAIGIAWGRFQRTTNVHAWNAAALPLNVAARLAYCPAAVGRVLVSPHVRNKAGVRAEFGSEMVCDVKGKPYQYHAIGSADYTQTLGRPATPAKSVTHERNIVLWDIIKYSTKDPDEQASLSHSLAICATTALNTFGASRKDYSPAGDGGFAVFDSGLTALEFSKALGRYATSRDITIRTGITQGEVAFTKRGPIGPGVLCADAISAQAPANGIAILAEVWRNLDRVARNDVRPTEISRDILALEPIQGTSASAPYPLPDACHGTAGATNPLRGQSTVAEVGMLRIAFGTYIDYPVVKFSVVNETSSPVQISDLRAVVFAKVKDNHTGIEQFASARVQLEFDIGAVREGAKPDLLGLRVVNLGAQESEGFALLLAGENAVGLLGLEVEYIAAGVNDPAIYRPEQVILVHSPVEVFGEQIAPGAAVILTRERAFELLMQPSDFRPWVTPAYKDCSEWHRAIVRAAGYLLLSDAEHRWERLCRWLRADEISAGPVLASIAHAALTYSMPQVILDELDNWISDPKRFAKLCVSGGEEYAETISKVLERLKIARDDDR